MKISISKEIRVGIVFVIATAVLIWGVMYLKGLEFFTHKRVVYAVYMRVNGLVKSNPVVISGLKVGQVKDLYFSRRDRGKIIAELYLINDYPIPKNSTAVITSSDLLGSKQVAIVIGDSQEMINEGDTLKATIEATLGEELNQQIIPLKKKTEKLIGSIDTLAGTLQQVLNESTRNNLAKSIENIKDALQNLSHLTYNIDTLVGGEKVRLSKIIKNVESISNNLKQNNDKINHIFTNFSNISDSIAKLNIPSTLVQVNNAIRNLSQVIDKVNKGNGSLGLLINNNDLYQELTKAAKDLNLLLEDIKANPKKYLKVSVF
ncbi:MAG: MlaD family protein [Bacteroidetes bacterium]|nr:MlaD family protein [Bacteroidota bacterium]